MSTMTESSRRSALALRRALRCPFFEPFCRRRSVNQWGCVWPHPLVISAHKLCYDANDPSSGFLCSAPGERTGAAERAMWVKASYFNIRTQWSREWVVKYNLRIVLMLPCSTSLIRIGLGALSSLNTVYQRIYQSVEDVTACFRLTNSTSQIGCSGK